MVHEPAEVRPLEFLPGHIPADYSNDFGGDYVDVAVILIPVAPQHSLALKFLARLVDLVRRVQGAFLLGESLEKCANQLVLLLRDVQVGA